MRVTSLSSVHSTQQMNITKFGGKLALSDEAVLVLTKIAKGEIIGYYSEGPAYLQHPGSSDQKRYQITVKHDMGSGGSCKWERGYMKEVWNQTRLGSDYIPQTDKCEYTWNKNFELTSVRTYAKAMEGE